MSSALFIFWANSAVACIMSSLRTSGHCGDAVSSTYTMLQF
uniref:Uncharacterized protein n=1 Tax=Anguilla anguilla TaxID=7936 RepID=A0A0E9W9U3_ANGAN